MTVHQFKFTILLCATAAIFSSCGRTQFGIVTNGSTKLEETELALNFFKSQLSVVSYQQPQLETNETQLAFQVTLPDGSNVADLQSQDFEVLENGVPVSNFLVQSQSTTTKQIVDIVFAVDVTGSMSPTIESAKMRLINFVNKSREKGQHTRMCLITFGDRTVKNCDRFYDNNPADPASQAQVDELISEISKLKALVGASDPGGADLNENPMRALIDTSKAPWGDKSQRFVILITDDGFLYSPSNQGDVGALAPKFSEVGTAIAESQMKVFAATPSLAGYNRSFQGKPGIVEASQGEWFNFNELIAGTITLDTILGRIMDRVQTTYLADYIIDDSSQLDPTLPLKKRKIEIVLKNGVVANVNVISIQSNLPEGRKPYNKKFKLSDRKIRGNTIRVKVDGVVVSGGLQLTAENEIEFSVAPKANAKIEIHFLYNELKDSVQLSPILLENKDVHSKIRIYLNGKIADDSDFELKKTLEGKYSLVLNARVTDESDPYDIVSNGGLQIEVKKQNLIQ